MRLLVALLCAACPAFAEGEPAGNFDYYVLALSWSPNWCLREGDARDAPQCDDRSDHGWTLHGLWPQYETGWPSYCRTTERDPSRGLTGSMVDLMGSSGLAFHQWKKHGRCSGLSASRYFEVSRSAVESVSVPDVFRRLESDIRLPAEVVEEAFLGDNPDLDADMITVTCRDGMIAEVRICLTPDLEFRRCGADVRRDCTIRDALFSPVR